MTEPREDDLRAAFASLHAPTSASRYADRVATTGAGGWTWRLPRRTSALVAIGTAAVVALGTVTTLELRGSPSHHSPLAFGASASASASASDLASATSTDSPSAGPSATPALRPTSTTLTFSGGLSGRLHVTSVNCDVNTIASPGPQGIMDAYGTLPDGTVHDILLYSNGRTSVNQIHVRTEAGVGYSQSGSAGVSYFDWRAGATVDVHVPAASGGPSVRVQGSIVCPPAPSPLPTAPRSTALTLSGALSGSLTNLSTSCATNVPRGPDGDMVVSGTLADGTQHTISIWSDGVYSPMEIYEGPTVTGGDFIASGHPVSGISDFDWSMGAVIHVTMGGYSGSGSGSTLTVNGTIRCGDPSSDIPPATPQPSAPPSTQLTFSGALSGSLHVVATGCVGHGQPSDIEVEGTLADGSIHYVEVRSTTETAPTEIDERTSSSPDQRDYSESGNPPSGVSNYDWSIGVTIHATLAYVPGGGAPAGTTLTIDGTIRCP